MQRWFEPGDVAPSAACDLSGSHAVHPPPPPPPLSPVSCSCQRVAVAQRTDLPQSLLWCTVYCSEAAEAVHGRRAAAAHLDAFLQGLLDLAPMQQQQQQQEQETAARDGGATLPAGAVEDGCCTADSGSRNRSDDGNDADEGEDDEGYLEDYLLPPAMHRHWQPLVTFVSVPELPRG